MIERDDPLPEDATGSRVATTIEHPGKRAMLAALARTGNVSAACRAAGVGRQTHYDWLASDPDYREGVALAKEEAIEVLEAAARRRALVGSDTLLIFLLKSARPEVYRERHDLRHTGRVEVQVDRTGLELLRDPEVAHALDRAFQRRIARRAETRNLN